MPVAPATMLRTNRSWPGHVDEREPRPVGQVERRVAEVDRDPARLLLGQPVGVLAGQRPDEPGLPVVDVPRCADRQRHRGLDQLVLDARRPEAALPSSSRHSGSFARGRRRAEHQQIEPLAAVRLVAVRHHRLEHEQARVGGRAGADRAQDRRRALVVPVVEDRRQDVDVALGHADRRSSRSTNAIRSPTPSRRAPSRAGRRRSRAAPAAARAGRAAASRCRRRRRRRSRPSRQSSAVEPLGTSALAPLHGAVEGGALVGMRGEPGPEVRPVERGQRPPAETRVERTRSGRSQTPPKKCANSRPAGVVAASCSETSVLRKTPGSSSAKTPSLASARSSRWSVSGSAPFSFGKLGDRARAAGELLGDAEVGDDAERRVTSAPRSESQSRASGARSLIARAALTAAATSSASASVSVRQSSSSPAVAHDCDHGRLAGTERRGELLLDRAGEARQLGQRQRAAADARRRSPRPRRRRARQSLGPRAHRVGRLAHHAQHRHLVERRSGRVERERPFERGERQLVGAQRALQRMAPQPLDELGASDDDAGLRAAEQLVAGEADEVGAGREARASRRLVARQSTRQRAGAEVVDERQLVALRDRRPARASDGSSVKPTTGSSTGARAGAPRSRAPIAAS